MSEASGRNNSKTCKTSLSLECSASSCSLMSNNKSNLHFTHTHTQNRKSKGEKRRKAKKEAGVMEERKDQSTKLEWKKGKNKKRNIYILNSFVLRDIKVYYKTTTKFLYILFVPPSTQHALAVQTPPPP